MLAMMGTRRRCHGWIRDERGAHLVEYTIAVGLISIAALAGFRTFGESVDAKVEAQAERVATLEPDGGGDDGGGGGFFDSVGGFFSDAGGGILDFGGGLLDGALDFGGGLLDGALGLGGGALDLFGEAVEFQVDFTIGFGQGALGAVTGLFDAVTHPADTIDGLLYAAENPFATAYTLGETWVNAIRDDPGRGLGMLGFEATVVVLTSGAATATLPSKASTAIEATAAADDVATAADAGQDAQGNDVPRIVELADEWIAPSISPVAQGIRTGETIVGWLR